MDTLEKIYEEQKQQHDIEEKEASYARHVAVKVINMFLCLAQVTLLQNVRVFFRISKNIVCRYVHIYSNLLILIFFKFHLNV